MALLPPLNSLGAFELLEQGGEVVRQGLLDPECRKAAQITPVRFGADQAPDAAVHGRLPFLVLACHRSALASPATTVPFQNGSCLAAAAGALRANTVKF